MALLGFILLAGLGLVPFAAAPAQAVSVYDYFTISYQVQLSKTVVRQGETFSATASGTAVCKAQFPITVSSATITSRVVATNQVGVKVTLNPSYTVIITPFPGTVGATTQITKEILLSFPQGADLGTYTVSGELIEARVQALISLPVTSFLPQSQAIGTVQYVAVSTPTPVPPPPAAPPPAAANPNPTTPAPQPTPVITPAPTPVPTPAPAQPGVTSLNSLIDPGTGKFISQAAAVSGDQKCSLSIAKDTKGLDKSGSPLSEISITAASPSPPPPQNVATFGQVYNLGPDGATFDPPVTISIAYDQAALPKGVTESQLAAGMFTGGKWEILTGGWVDTANHVVTGKVSHFTAFAILAYSNPATFKTQNLSINPSEAVPGTPVIIKADVSNGGDLAGSYNITLKVDNQTMAVKEISLGPGQSLPVSFSVTSDPGKHTVDLNGLGGSFTVLAPASFLLSSLTISPETASPGSQVTISALITNLGDLPGTYEAQLKIDNSVVASKSVSVSGKAQQPVSFTISRDEPGAYSVNMGGVTGTLNVGSTAGGPPPQTTDLPRQPPPPAAFPWWRVAGAVLLILALSIWLSLRHKKS